MSKEQSKSSFMMMVTWLSVAQLIAFALSFLTPSIVVRLLTPEHFGVYKQVFVILGMAITLLNLQFAASAYYFMPREPEKKVEITVNIILFYLAVGGTLAIICFCANILLPRIGFSGNGAQLIDYLPLLGVAMMLWLISNTLEVIPLTLGDVRTASIFVVLAQIVKTLLIIGSALLFRSVRAILWASILEGLIQSVFLGYYIRRRLGSIRRPIDFGLLKRQLSYSLPYGAGSASTTLKTELHNLFIMYFFSPVMFAVYSIGTFQLPLLNMLQMSFTNVITPEVVRLEAEGNHRGIIAPWLSATRKLAMLILPSCALLFLLRYELIVTLFTSVFAESAGIFGINVIKTLTLIVMVGSIMRAFKTFKFFHLKLNLFMIPFSFLTLYLGVKVGGLMGAVIAAVLIHVIDVSINLIVSIRKIGLTGKDLAILSPLLKALPAVAIAYLVSYSTKIMIGSAHSILIILVCSAVFGLTYAALVLIGGALTGEEKLRLRGYVRSFQQRFSSSYVS